MKYFTVPLVNKKKRTFKTFLLGQSAEQKHYRAQHVSEDITLLWLEASQFGKLHCFPCVLNEGGDMLVFRSASSKRTAELNAMLVQRWNLFVNPENIKTDYHVEEMDRKEFYALFNECQRKSIEDEADGKGVYASIGQAEERPAQQAEEQPVQQAEEQPAEQK